MLSNAKATSDSSPLSLTPLLLESVQRITRRFFQFLSLPSTTPSPSPANAASHTRRFCRWQAPSCCQTVWNRHLFCSCRCGPKLIVVSAHFFLRLSLRRYASARRASSTKPRNRQKSQRRKRPPSATPSSSPPRWLYGITHAHKERGKFIIFSLGFNYGNGGNGGRQYPGSHQPRKYGGAARAGKVQGSGPCRRNQ